jgi:hypothetical protein
MPAAKTATSNRNDQPVRHGVTSFGQRPSATRGGVIASIVALPPEVGAPMDLSGRFNFWRVLLHTRVP